MKIITTAATSADDYEGIENNHQLLEHIDIAFDIAGEPCHIGSIPGYIFHGVKQHQVGAFVEFARHFGQDHITLVQDDNRTRRITTDTHVYRMIEDAGDYTEVSKELAPHLPSCVRTYEGKFYAIGTPAQVATANRIVKLRGKLSSAQALESQIYGEFN